MQRIDNDMAVPLPDDLKDTADALCQLIRTLRQREVPPAQMPLQEPWQLDACGWVANRWCELLPLQLKQRLIALDNPLMRLELVSDLLARAGISN